MGKAVTHPEEDLHLHGMESHDLRCQDPVCRVGVPEQKGSEIVSAFPQIAVLPFCRDFKRVDSFISLYSDAFQRGPCALLCSSGMGIHFTAACHCLPAASATAAMCCAMAAVCSAGNLAPSSISMRQIPVTQMDALIDSSGW